MELSTDQLRQIGDDIGRRLFPAIADVISGASYLMPTQQQRLMEDLLVRLEAEVAEVERREADG